jgi:hypothetical protein
MTDGRCFCGFIQYRADGAPFNQTNCHCSICRRLSGAPFVTWFTVPSASFQFLSGQPSSVHSSDHGTRTFCPRCGTPLTFRSSHAPDEIDITVGSLNDPDALPPRDHTWTSAKVSWVRLDERLPVFAQGRSS